MLKTSRIRTFLRTVFSSNPELLAWVRRVYCFLTEGYDYEVLKQIDLERFRPSLVIYEYIHLSDDAKLASKNCLRVLAMRYITHTIEIM